MLQYPYTYTIFNDHGWEGRVIQSNLKGQAVTFAVSRQLILSAALPIVFFGVIHSREAVATRAASGSVSVLIREAPPANYPGVDWSQTNPSSAGWDERLTTEALQYAVGAGATAIMFIQHGMIVAASGDLSRKTELHSCRKSFLSALIGIAVSRGQLDLNSTLAQLGVDDVPPALSASEKLATVRDLLEARSGVYHEAAYETKGMEEKRPARGSHAAGTFWYYNNWDFNTLGGIYEQATHQGIYAAIEEELARPLGMQDFQRFDGKYVRSPVSRYPAYTFKMSARDLARFALLYLRGGKWQGREVVPSQWVQDSVHPWSDTASGGYGYLWWIGSPASSNYEAEYTFPSGSFWLEGHLGQYAVVVPSRDLIVVVRVAGDHPKKEIHKGQMAKLVRMVYRAAGHA